MSNISFPSMNLNLNISKVAFSVFEIDIYWYAIIIVASIIIALLICHKKDGLYGISFETILDFMIYVIPISIISARIYYVLFNIRYYALNPSQILNFRTGGLAIYGGIIGGLITIIILCKKRNINILDCLDYIVPSLAIAQSIGRWGNFINSEAYGIETNLPWRMGIFEAGLYKEVHPTFLYETIATLIIFIILTKMQKNRKFKGQITSWYLLLYGFARAIIETLRADSLCLYGIKVSKLVSIIVVIISTIFIIYNLSKNRLNVNKTSKKE